MCFYVHSFLSGCIMTVTGPNTLIIYFVNHQSLFFSRNVLRLQIYDLLLNTYCYFFFLFCVWQDRCWSSNILLLSKQWLKCGLWKRQNAYILIILFLPSLESLTKYWYLYYCSFVRYTYKPNSFFYRSRERCSWAIGESGFDVMTSKEQRVGPCSLLAPPLVRRDTSYQGGSRRASHLFTSFLHLPQSHLSVLYGGYYFQLFFLGWYGGSFQK